MERSPNLPLQFTDENLEPSASGGLNALAERFAVAMERSPPPNTGSKSGRQLIETAPRDGGFLILEEDTSGKTDIARWASEAGGWVQENGEPIKIRPSYWYSIKGESYFQHGLDISISPSQRGELAASQRQFASDIRTSRSGAAPPETVATAKIDAAAVKPKRASRARNRFAAFSIAASLVVAVCVGMYLRAEQDLRQSLLRERDRVAALTRELATARRDLETEVAQSSKATEEADRLRQVANAASAELEQERSRSAALARDLESAQRTIAASSTTERPAGNQPDPMKQGSRRELRRSRPGGTVRQARRRRLDRTAPELADLRPDRHRQKLACLCTRPQGLPRRPLRPLSSRAKAVRCPGTCTRRRASCAGSSRAWHASSC